MRTIKWLITLIPPEVRALVAILLIAVSALSSVVVYLYKQEQVDLKDYTLKVKTLNEYYQHKTDSLNLQIEGEKDKLRLQLEEVIRKQDSAIKVQNKHKVYQRQVININNSIIQRNEQRIRLKSSR